MSSKIWQMSEIGRISSEIGRISCEISQISYHLKVRQYEWDKFNSLQFLLQKIKPVVVWAITWNFNLIQ